MPCHSTEVLHCQYGPWVSSRSFWNLGCWESTATMDPGHKKFHITLKNHTHNSLHSQLITCDNYFTLFKSYWAMCAQLVIIFTFPDLYALVIQLDMAKVFISQILQPGLHTGLTKEDNGFKSNRLLQSHLTMNWCALWERRLLSTLDSSLLIHIIPSFFSPCF